MTIAKSGTKLPETISGFQGQYRFLSNFWPCDITYEGVNFPSSEHAYQTAKTLDPIERGRINFFHSTTEYEGRTLQHCRPTTPGEAKRAAGKKAKVPITIRPDWDSIKLQVMEDILRIKFSDPQLRSWLLGTGDAILIEENT